MEKTLHKAGPVPSVYPVTDGSPGWRMEGDGGHNPVNRHERQVPGTASVRPSDYNEYTSSEWESSDDERYRDHEHKASAHERHRSTSRRRRPVVIEDPRRPAKKKTYTTSPTPTRQSSCREGKSRPNKIYNTISDPADILPSENHDSGTISTAATLDRSDGHRRATRARLVRAKEKYDLVVSSLVDDDTKSRVTTSGNGGEYTYHGSDASRGQGGRSNEKDSGYGDGTSGSFAASASVVLRTVEPRTFPDESLQPVRSDKDRSTRLQLEEQPSENSISVTTEGSASIDRSESGSSPKSSPSCPLQANSDSRDGLQTTTGELVADLLVDVQRLRRRARELLFYTRHATASQARSFPPIRSRSTDDVGRSIWPRHAYTLRRSRSALSSGRASVQAHRHLNDSVTGVPSGDNDATPSVGQFPQFQGLSTNSLSGGSSWRVPHRSSQTENNCPTLKRQRTSEAAEKTDDGAKLPCIFFVGEPTTYPDHIQKYEFIALLLRHLKTHDFHACQFCFQRFETNAILKHHMCVKACTNVSCRRKVAIFAARPTHCVCIITARDQWQALYKLQYPTDTVPTESVVENPIEVIRGPSISEEYLDSFEFDSMLEVPLEGVDDSSASEKRNSVPLDLAPEPPVTSSSQLQALTAEMQMLRQQIHILEQRVTSQPTQREEDLEMTLGLVWEGFCRSGSREAQPEGSLWRLVRRHAPNVLSTAATSLAQPTQPILQQSQSTEQMMPDFDWQSLINFPAPDSRSKAPAADSAYGSGTMM